MRFKEIEKVAKRQARIYVAEVLLGLVGVVVIPLTLIWASERYFGYWAGLAAFLISLLVLLGLIVALLSKAWYEDFTELS